MFLMILLFCSCINKQKNLAKDPFYELYNELSLKRNDTFEDKLLSSASEIISISANKMPLSVFCRILSDTYNFGIVYNESLSDKLLTCEFKNSDVDIVFNIISRQLNVDVVKVGNTYYIGNLKNEDKAIFTARIFGYENLELKQLLVSMLSTQGKVEVLKNGLVIVNDHENVIRRVISAVSYIQSVEVNTWIVQLYFVTIKKDLLLKAGLNVSTSGNISYNISENKLSFDEFQINGLFNANGEGNLSDIFLSPMFIIRDGQEGLWSKGESYPLPKYTTSEVGSVTISGYDYIDTGFNLKGRVSETARGGSLALDISISSITSYVEKLPVITKTQLKLNAEMESKKLYLLGDLSEYTQIHNLTSILMFGRDTGNFSVQVWGQIYKIKGQVKKEIPKIEEKKTIDILSKTTNF